MSIYFYAPKIYPGTRELMDVLQAKRIVRHDGMRYLYKGAPIEFNSKDAIVCWGAHAPAPQGLPCLSASYEFPSMLDINTRGLARASHQGFSISSLLQVNSSEYAKNLYNDNGNWWPTKRPVEQLVSVPELEGYAALHRGYTAMERSIVFKGDLLVGKGDQIGFQGLLESLKLDFAAIYWGTFKNGYAYVKVITAPTLSAVEVPIIATSIVKWAKS